MRLPDKPGQRSREMLLDEGVRRERGACLLAAQNSPSSFVPIHFVAKLFASRNVVKIFPEIHLHVNDQFTGR